MTVLYDSSSLSRPDTVWAFPGLSFVAVERSSKEVKTLIPGTPLISSLSYFAAPASVVWLMHACSLGSIGFCIALWIRAQDHRRGPTQQRRTARHVRRTFFPTFWLIWESVENVRQHAKSPMMSQTSERLILGADGPAVRPG